VDFSENCKIPKKERGQLDLFLTQLFSRLITKFIDKISELPLHVTLLGSPLSPVIADIVMQELENMVICER